MSVNYPVCVCPQFEVCFIKASETLLNMSSVLHGHCKTKKAVSVKHNS